MWMRVDNQSGATEYVDLDRVIKIVFTTNTATKKVGGAILYAIGGDGFVNLGSVTGDISLRKLQEHVGLIRSDNVVI